MRWNIYIFMSRSVCISFFPLAKFELFRCVCASVAINVVVGGSFLTIPTNKNVRIPCVCLAGQHRASKRANGRNKIRQTIRFSFQLFFWTKMMIKFYKHSLLFPEFPNVSGHFHMKNGRCAKGWRRECINACFRKQTNKKKKRRKIVHIFKEHRCRLLHRAGQFWTSI